jgi:hypothetical protein
MAYELPGAMVKSPRFWLIEGALLKVVDWVAGSETAPNVTLPSPLKEKAEVSRSSCFGKRKTRLQVLPASEAGMSKLKIVETVEETVPLKEVPMASSGEDESTGTIR